MKLYIDTCVMPRCRLEEAVIYRQNCGADLGFELLPMFDLPEFEENLCRNLSVFAEGPLIFHEPVWGVEHTARRGSPAWEESMHHLKLTRRYAEILHPTHLIYHFNNCAVSAARKQEMLDTSLENLENMRALFPEQEILAENTGIRKNSTMMLDQDEFTELCREQDLNVLVDVGHAHANGWDLDRLLRDMGTRIRGFHLHNNDGVHDLHNRINDGTLAFDRLMPLICQIVPQAFWVIEYTRPVYNRGPVWEDVEQMKRYRTVFRAAQLKEQRSGYVR